MFKQGHKKGKQTLVRIGALVVRIWEFPIIRGTLFWGPYNKGPTV